MRRRRRANAPIGPTAPPSRDDAPSEPHAPRPRWRLYALIAALTALPWLNAVTPALTVDDASFPPEPASTLSLSTFARYFREDAWAAARIRTGAYRPLSLSLTRLESLLWGTDPRGYHATSVALHVAVTLAVFALVRSLLRASSDDDDDSAPDLSAAMAALVFGAHPIHTEAVDSIFNRSEVLATLGVVAAIALLVREAHRRPALAWGGASALYLLALFSKESAATMPALAALALFLARRPTSARDAARLVAPALLFAIPLGVYLASRTSALASTASASAESRGLGAPSSWGDRVTLTITALEEFWRMLAWPSPLRASYDDFNARGVGAALVVHGAIVWLAVALRRRAPAVTVGAAMVYVALLPVTRLVSHLGVVVTVAERYVYLPSVGFALASGGAFFVVSKRAAAVVTLVVGAALYLAAAPITWLRNDDWRSDLTLWSAEVSVAPENPDAWKWLTGAYLNAGRWDDVIRVCEARAPQPVEHAPLLVHCAFAYEARGRGDDAERALLAAATREASPGVLLPLARRQARLGRAVEARATYERAIAAEPDPVRRRTLRGEMLLRAYTGRASEAAAEFSAALAEEPRYEPASVGLSRARQTR